MKRDTRLLVAEAVEELVERGEAVARLLRAEDPAMSPSNALNLWAQDVSRLNEVVRPLLQRRMT